MDLPETPAPPPPSVPIISADPAPLITSDQRETDFHRLFAWHGTEIALTLAGEFYYRELRAHMNAPPLGSYQTMADFTPEAMRILYCAHLDQKTARALRLLPPFRQIELFDAWVESNVKIHEIDAAAKLADEMQAVIARARTTPAETNDDLDGMGNSPSHP